LRISSVPFSLPIDLKAVIEFFLVSLAESANVSKENHIIFDIILIIILIHPQLHSVFEYILQTLTVHLHYINQFLVLFDLFLINIALVHESVFIFLLDLFLFHRQLIDLCNVNTTVFYCSVFSFIRPVIMYYFSYIIFLRRMYYGLSLEIKSASYA